MSVDVFVFLQADRLPTTARWQRALDELGVDVKLIGDVEPASHSGYWPAELQGTPSGFEFYFGRIADAYGAAPPAGLGDRDCVVDLVTHSDLRELKCSMLAASALARVADGLILDGDTGELQEPSQFLEEALAITDGRRSARR